MQYFAQDEASRLDPALTVYQTLAGDAPIHMVPHIRTILGGFLFSGDDIEKPVRVLSGGERTRLAVARMLLNPANTLLLDEPTNHLDLDSKDVLLEALEDFGGTLIFVSHDRYFVDKLATKIIEVGRGDALVYPGAYEEFLWSKQQREAAGSAGAATGSARPGAQPRAPEKHAGGKEAKEKDRRDRKESAPQMPYADRKRQEADARRARKDVEARQRRVQDLEARIADRELAIKDLERAMAAPGFYDDRDAAKPIIDRHQALMWEVGDLMHQWETLQTETKV
jgi:ATP-binding cassette subfamily F protein 3